MREISGRAMLRQAIARDAAAKAREAIPLYRRAISQGLKPNELHAAMVGLGSSLRTTGQIAAALRVLQKASRLFLNDPTVTLFLAMTHRDAGQGDLALRQLADLVLKESRNPVLKGYRKTLQRRYHALR